MKHLSLSELEAGLAQITESPASIGTVELIVRRPSVGIRELVEIGELDINQGLVGDNWATRGSSKTPDGSSHPEMQLNIMNSRSAALIAESKARWPLAGDQFYVDLDLSDLNLPPGALLQIGQAEIEVTAMPHLGCKKFVERFGRDAMRFVNSKVGKTLNLRGINARIVRGGKVSVGDTIRKK